ncbi:MAG TPA: DUF4446 family protein [Candidatus Paceibacterota bacterium]
MQIWLLGGLVVAVLFLALRLFFIERLLRRFQGKTPEGVLMEHSSAVGVLQQESAHLHKAIAALAADSVYSVQKVGMVRFNPFSDTGGDQSFAIALLDGQNNGIVMSSLYVQGHPMVYAKPIEKGESRYVLTDEEKKALLKATSRA